MLKIKGKEVSKSEMIYLTSLIGFIGLCLLVSFGVIKTDYITPKPPEIKHYEEIRDKLTIPEQTNNTTNNNPDCLSTYEYEAFTSAVKNLSVIIPIIAMIMGLHAIYEFIKRREQRYARLLGQLVGAILMMYVGNEIMQQLMLTIC